MQSLIQEIQYRIERIKFVRQNNLKQALISFSLMQNYLHNL